MLNLIIWAEELQVQFDQALAQKNELTEESESRLSELNADIVSCWQQINANLQHHADNKKRLRKGVRARLEALLCLEAESTPEKKFA